jgi:YVTN family beta-propeller protein
LLRRPCPGRCRLHWAYTEYVTNERDNTVSVVNLDQMRTIATVSVEQRPRGIALTLDGTMLLVCASDDDTIQEIDTKTLRISGTLPSGPDPESFVLDASGNRLYVSNEDDNLATVIDVPTRTTNMAHFIDTTAQQMISSVLVGARPRACNVQARWFGSLDFPGNSAGRAV